jgi:hypothetical protein
MWWDSTMARVRWTIVLRPPGTPTPAKLVLWEEVGGKVGRRMFEDSEGKEAAPGESDPKRAKFGEV